MGSRFAYRYSSLPTTESGSTPAPTSAAIDTSVDHPPVDLHPRRSSFRHSTSSSPPLGVAFSAVVIVCFGLYLLLMAGGVDLSLVIRVPSGALQLVCLTVGCFLCVSGGYTLYHWLYEGSTRPDGGYLFPSFGD